MLTPNDKQLLKDAIKTYKKDGFVLVFTSTLLNLFYEKAFNYRDINNLMKKLERTLDTPEKLSLWFNIIPIFDDDDQEYLKKKLCSSSFMLFQTNPDHSPKNKDGQIINNNQINIQIPEKNSKPPLLPDFTKKNAKINNVYL